MKMVLLALVLLTVLAGPASPAQSDPGYYCAPCACANDGKTLTTGGTCPLCGMELLRVGTFNYTMPFAAPSGAFVYESNKPGGKMKIFYRPSAADTAERMLCEGSMPLLSPDGKRVLYSPREGVVAVYDLAAGAADSVSLRFGLVNPQTASWTPDGSGFICAAGTFPKLGIYRVEPRSGRVDTLVAADAMRYGCVYSPTGDRIAYRCVKQKSETERERGLVVFDVVSRTERFITPTGEYCAWSPDGTQLLFQWANERKKFCIFKVNADGTGLAKIAEADGGDNEMPRWSPDAKKVYFQTNRRQGNWEIWTMHPDGTHQEPLITR